MMSRDNLSQCRNVLRHIAAKTHIRAADVMLKPQFVAPMVRQIAVMANRSVSQSGYAGATKCRMLRHFSVKANY